MNATKYFTSDVSRSDANIFKMKLTIGKRFLLCWLIMGIVALTTANFGLKIEDNSEHHEAELRLRKDLQLNKYNFTRNAPRHNKTSPVKVNIGLILIKLTDLDARTQTLTTQMWYPTSWQDKRYTWNPTEYENITELRVSPGQLWLPDLTLLNSAKMSQRILGGYTYAMLYNDGWIYFVPPATLDSICEVNLKYYPYDVHTCKLKFASWTMSGAELDLVLIPDSHLSLENAYNEGGEWEAVSSNAVYSTTKYECCEESYPDVTFTLVVRRRSPLYKLAVLVPVLASVGIALAAFCLSPVSQIRILINALALLLLILELTHLSTKVPPVGSSTPIIVSVSGIAVILVAISTMLTASTVSFLRSRVGVPTLPHSVKTFVAWKPIELLSSKGSFISASFKLSLEEQKLDETDAENPFDGDQQAIKNNNYDEWLGFFQVIDRIAFIVFLFTTLLVMIVTSI